MNYSIKMVMCASDLTEEWDEIAGEYFKSKTFLCYLEKYNPCNQRYYELYSGDEFRAGIIMYTFTLDLLMFLHIPSPVKMHIIGVPVSVCSSGFVGREDDIMVALQFVFRMEKGIILGLNTEPDFEIPSLVIMPTLPVIEMQLPFLTLEEYKNTLRSSYRRHFSRNRELFNGTTSITGRCALITPQVYELYEQVFNKTKTKLEKLSYEFFRSLPDPFVVTIYYYRDEPLTWHVVLKDTKTLFFFFGGINYKYNRQFSAYFNNLIGIVEKAISEKYQCLNLGSTAEIAKLRLGGKIARKNMFVYHRNPLVKGLFRLFRGLLAYNTEFPISHVFRESEDV